MFLFALRVPQKALTLRMLDLSSLMGIPEGMVPGFKPTPPMYYGGPHLGAFRDILWGSWFEDRVALVPHLLQDLHKGMFAHGMVRLVEDHEFARVQSQESVVDDGLAQDLGSAYYDLAGSSR